MTHKGYIRPFNEIGKWCTALPTTPKLVLLCYEKNRNILFGNHRVVHASVTGYEALSVDRIRCQTDTQSVGRSADGNPGGGGDNLGPGRFVCTGKGKKK